jgi:hypothetical protein
MSFHSVPSNTVDEDADDGVMMMLMLMTLIYVALLHGRVFTLVLTFIVSDQVDDDRRPTQRDNTLQRGKQ